MNIPKNPYIAWLTCALFFLFQYALRVTPNVMMGDLRESFSVNADQYATLGSYYLYAYALAQLPLGFLVDRYGIRRITLLSLLACCGGLLLSTIATAFYHLQLARILIGFGSGVAFMAALKLAADHFPEKTRGIFMGLTLTFGTVGALASGKPLVGILETHGWRDTFLYLTYGFIPLVLLAFFTLPSTKIPQQKNAFSTTIKTINGIFDNRYLLIYTVLAIGLYTPLSSLADLWGTSFLMKKYGFSLSDAALANTMMYLGMAIGSLILGAIFKCNHGVNRGIQLSGIGLLVVTAIILYGPSFSLIAMLGLLFTMGMFCGAEMLCFTGASFHTTKETSGITLGFVNTLNMLGGAILQQLIGIGLDYQWSGALTKSGIRDYSIAEFITALSLLIIIIGVCVVLSGFLTKKPSQQT